MHTECYVPACLAGSADRQELRYKACGSQAASAAKHPAPPTEQHLGAGHKLGQQAGEAPQQRGQPLQQLCCLGKAGGHQRGHHLLLRQQHTQVAEDAALPDGLHTQIRLQPLQAAAGSHGGEQLAGSGRQRQRWRLLFDGPRATRHALAGCSSWVRGQGQPPTVLLAAPAVAAALPLLVRSPQG